MYTGVGEADCVAGATRFISSTRFKMTIMAAAACQH
jgi:hypothetical protein